MQEDETKRFRYSIVPDWTLRVPAIRVWEAELHNDSIWYHTYSGRGDDLDLKYRRSRLVELPDELYLRELMELDLADDTALLSFVNQYGMLGQPAGRAPRDTGRDESVLPGWLSLSSKHYGDSGYDAAKLNPVKEEAGYEVQTLFSVRTHARCLRDAVRLWRVVSEQMSLAELREAWELPPVFMNPKEPVAPPADVDGALSLLRDIFNAGLQIIQARIVIFEPGDVQTETLTNLYPALFLQLFNHMVENAVYIRCHNEKCGRLFVRQRGRAKQGKYHTRGVMYCSDYCARAQGQRELRRRKARQSPAGRP